MNSLHSTGGIVVRQENIHNRSTLTWRGGMEKQRKYTQKERRSGRGGMAAAQIDNSKTASEREFNQIKSISLDRAARNPHRQRGGRSEEMMRKMIRNKILFKML